MISEGTRSDAAVAVLVSSCDRFFDAWRPFAGFWRQHWPREALPWRVYLIVNELGVRSDWLTPLSVGRDRGWSDNLRLVLERLEVDYLLYLQEDYFLTAPPEADWLTTTLARLRAEQVDLLCGTCARGPSRESGATPRCLIFRRPSCAACGRRKRGGCARGKGSPSNRTPGARPRPTGTCASGGARLTGCVCH